MSRAVLGATWTTEHELLASMFDTLQNANWQRTQNRRVPRPKPYPRPGRGPKVLGGSAVPVEEMRSILDNWSNN